MDNNSSDNDLLSNQLKPNVVYNAKETFAFVCSYYAIAGAMKQVSRAVGCKLALSRDIFALLVGQHKLIEQTLHEIIPSDDPFFAGENQFAPLIQAIQKAKDEETLHGQEMEKLEGWGVGGMAFSVDLAQKHRVAFYKSKELEKIRNQAKENLFHEYERVLEVNGFKQ